MCEFCLACPCHCSSAPWQGPSGTPAPSTPAMSVAVRGQCGLPLPLSNFARNSLAATSNHELTSLELQRVSTVSKSNRGKLCASFAWLAPVTARRLRGVSLRALRCPPHRRRCVADVWLGASSWSPPWPRCPPILLRQFRMQFPFRYFKV